MTLHGHELLIARYGTIPYDRDRCMPEDMFDQLVPHKDVFPKIEVQKGCDMSIRERIARGLPVVG